MENLYIIIYLTVVCMKCSGGDLHCRYTLKPQIFTEIYTLSYTVVRLNTKISAYMLRTFCKKSNFKKTKKVSLLLRTVENCFTDNFQN